MRQSTIFIGLSQCHVAKINKETTGKSHIEPFVLKKWLIFYTGFQSLNSDFTLAYGVPVATENKVIH